MDRPIISPRKKKCKVFQLKVFSFYRTTLVILGGWSGSDQREKEEAGE